MPNLYLKKFINPGIYLIVFLIPIYIFSLKIWFIPTNLLELLIGVLFIFWLFLNFKELPEIVGNIFKNRFFLPILLIFIGVTLSTVFSVDIRTSAGIWKGWFVIPLLFFIMLINEVRNKKQAKNIILSLFFSGIGVALVSLFYFFNHNLTYDGRLTSFYYSPNHLAMYLSPILILSLWLYSYFKKWFVMVFVFTGQYFLLSVIYLTYSYGAWAGLVAALFFVLMTTRHYRRFFKDFNRKKNIFYLFGAIFLIIIFFFFSQINSQKFQELLNFSYSSLSSRLVIWQSAWEITKDHSLNGIGPGLFQKYYLDKQSSFAPYSEWAVPQPHNLFLAFWLQTGVIGLVGFLWLLIRFFKSGFSCLLKNKDNCAEKLLIIILMAAMVYVITHGLIDTTYWKNDLSIVFLLIIALNYKAVRFSC